MWGPWVIWIQGPRPVSRETVVECEMGWPCSGDMVGPLPAGDFDWLCPGDPIARYRVMRAPAAARKARQSEAAP